MVDRDNSGGVSQRLSDIMDKKRVLVISPHTDDADVGVGGTLIKLGKDFNVLHIALTDCMDIERNAPYNLKDEFISAQKLLDIKSRLYDFPNRRFPENSFKIRDLFEELKRELVPDIVLCPSPKDIHQDHYATYLESFRVFRNSTILAYESPRSTMGFLPSLYVALDEDIVRQKCTLVGMYKSQEREYYMQADSITALARHRGAEIGRKFAEGFEIIRMVIE